jgi:hypothetical protein
MTTTKPETVFFNGPQEKNFFLLFAENPAKRRKKIFLVGRFYLMSDILGPESTYHAKLSINSVHEENLNG